MNWYNYFFAALAVAGVMFTTLVAMPINTKHHNNAGMLHCFFLLAVWVGLFYWNVLS